VQAGPDRPHRDVQGLGRLVVAQFRPGDQQQQIAVGGREPGQRGGKPGLQPLGGDLGGAALVERLGQAVRGRTGQNAVAARLGAAMLTQGLGRDAVEPGTGVRAREVGLRNAARNVSATTSSAFSGPRRRAM
jgi:hypothetical protein